MLPTTAPFQAVSFSDLFGHVRAMTGAVSQLPVVSTTRETAVSIVPPLDRTQGRLKLERAERWNTQVEIVDGARSLEDWFARIRRAGRALA